MGLIVVLSHSFLFRHVIMAQLVSFRVVLILHQKYLPVNEIPYSRGMSTAFLSTV